jgi:hypothetical protein
MLLTQVALFSQSVTREQIINGPYYYGEGTAASEQEAYDLALRRLTESIFITVQSQFLHQNFEDGKDFKDVFEGVVSTYSIASLPNLKRLPSISNERGITVFCYVAKSGVGQIFEERKKLAWSIYSAAVAEDATNNITQALKLYYFAGILLNSLPEQFVEFNGVNLTTEIPKHINNVLMGIEFLLLNDEKTKANERTLTIAIRRNAQPVVSLDFVFFDAKEISVSANDGKAVVKLFGASVGFTKLDLRIKYSYYECKDEHKVVGELWGLVKKPQYKNIKQFDLKTVVTPPVAVNPLSKIYSKSNIELRLLNEDSCPVLDKISNETVTMIELINNRAIDKIKSTYKSDSFLRDKLIRILNYNRSAVVDHTIEASVNKTSTGWELRRIGLLNSYPSINRMTTDYIVLDFDQKGVIQDATFSLTDSLYNQYVKSGGTESEMKHRQEIMKFLEKYRTAFLSRDVETINTIFSDDAVIIVGRLLRSSPSKDLAYTQRENAPSIEYVRYTKKQYVENVRKTFQLQKDIFLGFATFKILKKNNVPVYGISMRQNYSSTGYGDEGYLLLVIDFDGPEPKIKFRSWQPSEWEDAKLIRLSDFAIH